MNRKTIKVVSHRVEGIPRYKLEASRQLHRAENPNSDFGNNRHGRVNSIKGFQLYSSDGMVVQGCSSPLKSKFYRISIIIRGAIDVQIGLEQYRPGPRSVFFTFPDQIFSKSNMSRDAFGYYILFDEDFLSDLIPPARMADEFPFFSFSGVPLFQTSEKDIARAEEIVLKIDDELNFEKPEREKAVRLHLYLLLLEAKRSYERQHLGEFRGHSDSHVLVSKYRKLVNEHFLTKRKVADYASMLHVTPNHLNRTVKRMTDQTASSMITGMLVQEAKALLKCTDLSASEIAYRLDFSEPAAFNRFFRKSTGTTPQIFRQQE